jgi:glycosyltransferase involved in cell wall biosynthesis
MSNYSPKVSIWCPSYNHEKYIAQAIEGFLMQKVNFPIEIIIHDDASTDKTAQVIKEYEVKYPYLLKCIYQSENQLSKDGGYLTKTCLQIASGKYIALCEGDDYWTDPHKLQKQVDFLEKNEGFAICFHNMKIIYDDSRETHYSNPPDQRELTTLEDLACGNYIYTASCVFRNGLIKEFPTWYKDAPVGDYVLHMLNAQYGKIKYFDEVMGVYRVHKDGIWENNNFIFRIEKWIELLELMKNHFTTEVNDILIQTQSNHYSNLIKHYQNNSEKCKYYSKLKIDSNPYLIVELNKQIEDLLEKNAILLNSNTYKAGAFLLKPYSILKRLLNA